MKSKPTAAGFQQWMTDHGHPPLRFLDAISRGIYRLAYERSLALV